MASDTTTPGFLSRPWQILITPRPEPSIRRRRSEERRVGKEARSLCDWSSDVCSSDLNWTTYSQAFGNPTVDTNTKTIGFYGQDQFRITPDVVLNYGVRYDYTWIPQPTLANPDYPQTGTINSAKEIGRASCRERSEITV